MTPHTNIPFSKRLHLPTGWAGLLIDVVLIGLVVLGISLRLRWDNWNQDTNLHPDEYGLTNTITQLSLPETVGDYFNTRLSPLSPYRKYDYFGQATVDGPDNRLRWGQWPIILIRSAAEMTGNTGYTELRLMGRRMSALADILSLLLLYGIGRRLYNHRTGLLAAALSALAVMQIQQSHFMTVDNFGVLFTMLTLYACVRIAQQPAAIWRPQGGYHPNPAGWKWYLLFGVGFGMALASRINLLPLGGLLLMGAFISLADLKLKSHQDLPRIVWIAILMMAVSGIATLVTFRVTQPMSFRSPIGNTTLLTITPNPDWVDSMQVAQSESNGIGGGPPAEQWAHRPAIIFPLVNMVFWGMGLPLGVMVWAAFLWALWRLFRTHDEWRSHLIPLVWTGGYFLFMATRWVKSIRYFLPIYPFLCLLAAWGILQLWQKARGRTRTMVWAAVITSLVVGGTFLWAESFASAVYRQDHTRIQASKWIFQNIPSPFHLALETAQGTQFIPVGAPDGLEINSEIPYAANFTAPASGNLTGITLPHVASSGQDGALHITITSDGANSPLTELVLPVSSAQPGSTGTEVTGQFPPIGLQTGQTYTLTASVQAQAPPVLVSRNVVSNEDWDEGLPLPMLGYDPYGQFYRGTTMNVRWYDDENKKQMFLETIAETDFIILPSQRAIWSASRIPVTYPMTLDYYRALFNGSLGFDLVASFSAPLKLGPLEISDVGGTAAWDQTPKLPLFNNNLLAAEEAFSVYDHPPVWIFKKRADFNIQAVQAILDQADLSKVVVQSPRDATILPVH